MTDLKFGWRNLNKKFYFIQDSRDGIVKDYNWNSYTEQDFSRGTDAISVYGNDTPPLSSLMLRKIRFNMYREHQM